MRLTSADSGSPFHQRLDMIEVLRTEATRFLTTVTQPALQQQLRLAGRDLDEAETWISTNTDSPPIVAVIDLLLELAASRIQIVAEAVRVYGPDAATMGR